MYQITFTYDGVPAKTVQSKVKPRAYIYLWLEFRAVKTGKCEWRYCIVDAVVQLDEQTYLVKIRNSLFPPAIPPLPPRKSPGFLPRLLHWHWLVVQHGFKTVVKAPGRWLRGS